MSRERRGGTWSGGGHWSREPDRLAGACSAGNESLPRCQCGGRMRFDMDMIGRSFACCDHCERVVPLAALTDPVPD